MEFVDSSSTPAESAHELTEHHFTEGEYPSRTDAQLYGLDGGETGDITWVPIGVLHLADHPRLDGVDERHAKTLAESWELLPPILVQRRSMRVIDGTHRLRAAELLQKSHIRARLLDDDDDLAFIRAVRANVLQGLPLSLADRKAAAARILRRHPNWSDRAVAKTAGLSDKTVGGVRRATADIPQLTVRVGQDGRNRRVAVATGEADTDRTGPPTTSPGPPVVPATAGGTGGRISDNDKSAPHVRPGGNPGSNQAWSPTSGIYAYRFQKSSVLSNLTRDPSLRYTETGRIVLRWLHRHPTLDNFPVQQIAGAIPPHCLPIVARLCRQYALEWQTFAEILERRLSAAGHDHVCGHGGA